MASKVETNFMRLLSRCETMAAEKTRDWRLEKYIDALQNQLGELRRSPSKPNQEVLANYNRKVEFLRGLLEAETMLTSTDKAAATQKLNPGRNSSHNCSTPQTKELHLQAKARYESEMRDELLGKSSQQDKGGVRQRKAVEEEEDDIDAVMQQHHKMQQKIADE
ncbi:vesicle transport protein USE1, partial [Lingula anatina]|uniref:Vesicle transport protein USE1 n=1 Tax=Lingula anatina TaxID=7574 RepID=A0A2R2MQA7_LINAN